MDVAGLGGGGCRTHNLRCGSGAWVPHEKAVRVSHGEGNGGEEGGGVGGRGEGGKRESDREAGPYAKGQSHWCVMSDTLRMLYGRGEHLEAVRERFGERDGSAKQWFVTRRGPRFGG